MLQGFQEEIVFSSVLLGGGGNGGWHEPYWRTQDIQRMGKGTSFSIGVKLSVSVTSSWFLPMWENNIF